MSESLEHLKNFLEEGLDTQKKVLCGYQVLGLQGAEPARKYVCEVLSQ